MSKLIVSFTSYPQRITAVKTVLDSLYSQTMKADDIILWLAEEEFPNKEADLPLSLKEDLAAKRFTLRWCDNLGSHKKYFYAMQEFPEDIIVTVDDDAFYHEDMLRKLMDAHARFPRSVVAGTASLIRFDSSFSPLKISEWFFDFQFLDEPSMLLMAIGVGGVLYPPHSVSKKIFDKEFILESCTVNGRTCGDDLLLKAGEILNHTPVVSVKSKRSAHRLKKAVSDFEALDNRLGLQKKYWITMPSQDLKRQLGYLSLPDVSPVPDEFDYKRIRDISVFAARVFIAYPPDSADEGAAKAFSSFRKQLLDIPNIELYAGSNPTMLGIIKYGVPLNLACTMALAERSIRER